LLDIAASGKKQSSWQYLGRGKWMSTHNGKATGGTYCLRWLRKLNQDANR
jgi:hypothetical protein